MRNDRNFRIGLPSYSCDKHTFRKCIKNIHSQFRKGRDRKISLLACLSGLAFFVISYFSGAVAAQGGKDELDQVLRSWITRNVYFSTDRDNRDTLFIRKRPVRTHIVSDDPEIVVEARKAVANFANAFGLGYEFTTTNVNLLVVTANGIADNGKPNRRFLSGLGLAESEINEIADKDNWSEGCGVYDSHNSDGRILIGVVAGDKILREKLKSCLVSGIIAGFGLRIQGEKMLTDVNDYVQFLLLARSLSECDKKIMSQNLDKTTPIRGVYLECVLGGLKAKLSE
jgi:hypothetical protein